MDERMSAQIVSWDKYRGFGFAQAEKGTERFFVHVGQQRRAVVMPGGEIWYLWPGKDSLIAPTVGSLISFVPQDNGPEDHLRACADWAFCEQIEEVQNREAERQKMLLVTALFFSPSLAGAERRTDQLKAKRNIEEVKRQEAQAAEERMRQMAFLREQLPAAMAKISTEVGLADKFHHRTFQARRGLAVTRRKGGGSSTDLISPSPAVWARVNWDRDRKK